MSKPYLLVEVIDPEIDARVVSDYTSFGCVGD